tara:strand:- start:1221 stop:1475 length:255 start_codon:yes stop_codon:yes gene_type:complete
MKIDLSETKPVYELHIWHHWDDESEAYASLLGDEFFIPHECIKFDDKDEAIEAYNKLVCGYKILMEYAGEEGDTLLEYSRGDDE